MARLSTGFLCENDRELVVGRGRVNLSLILPRRGPSPGRQPADRRMSNIERAGNLARRFAGIEPGERLAPLLGVELEPPTEFDAASHGARATFRCPGQYQFALELSEAAQDGQHQPAMRRGCVGPCVAQ